MIILNIIATLGFIFGHPLTHKRKLSAFRRWVFWQVGSRLVPGPVAFSFVNGAKLLVRPGMTGATGSIYCGLHEFESMAFALHLLQPKDVFLDVGANVGTYSILAASNGAYSLSLEPVKQTYDFFIENVHLNNFGHLINGLNVAVSDSKGRVRMSTELDTVNHIIGPDEDVICKKTVMVECENLDYLAVDLSPTLIKIDVEGHEPQVLDGAVDIMKKESLLAVILEVNSLEAHEKMISVGFKPYRYSPFERCLTPLNSFNTEEPNTLYIRDIEKVNAKVTSAPHFSVLDQRV